MLWKTYLSYYLEAEWTPLRHVNLHRHTSTSVYVYTQTYSQKKTRKTRRFGKQSNNQLLKIQEITSSNLDIQPQKFTYLSKSSTLKK